MNRKKKRKSFCNGKSPSVSHLDEHVVLEEGAIPQLAVAVHQGRHGEGQQVLLRCTKKNIRFVVLVTQRKKDLQKCITNS